MNIDKSLKVKILVIGDSGVGKSSLAHLLCYDRENKNPGYTIGCSVHIKLHDYKAGTPEEQTYCLELWDIGASKSHRNSRFIFYNGVNGIILVHDLSNRKTLANLPKWLNEVLNKDVNAGLSSVSIGGNPTIRHYNDEDDDALPVLMVGSKIDLTSEAKREEVARRSSLMADEINCDEIHLDCLDGRFVAAGTGNAVKLSRFLDKAILNAKQKRTMPKNDITPQKLGGYTTGHRRVNNSIPRLGKGHLD